MQRVALINSGCANIASVRYALLRQGVQVDVTADPERIVSADKVIFPGVGSFDYALEAVEKSGVVEAMRSLTQPTLGICLGMQMLAEASAEGQKPGLGLLEGKAQRFDDAPGRSVPHMGWNQLTPVGDDPLMAGIEPGSYVYFVHSYYLPPSPYTVATCDYGQSFTASLHQDNFWGCQFHPELSSDVGAKILANFLAL